MTETEIILLMVKCMPVLIAVWVFMHLLCEEYLRALEVRGLIPPRTPSKPSAPAGTESEAEGAADEKSG